MLTRTSLLATAAAVCALVPASASTASAAEITYIEHDNVVVENLDGSARHALSTDGTAARPYVLPTADQHGNLAAFQPAADTGQQEIVYWLGGAGEPQRHRMPRYPGDTTTSAPTSARMQPDGLQPILAYTYLAFGDPAQPRYGRVDPALPHGAQAESSIDYTDLTWYRERPVVARPEGVIYWTGASRQLMSSNVAGTKLTFAEISEDGTRILVRMEDAAGVKTLGLFAYEGDIPYGEITSGCALPVGAGFARGALSRDGKTVAWDDAGGVHLAQAEPDRFDEQSTCVLAGRRVVTATGRMPSFSAASTSMPPNGGTTTPGGGTTTPGGGTTMPGGGTTTPDDGGGTTTKPPASTKTFKLTAPAKLKVSSLRRGVTLKATAPKAGRVVVTLRRGKRVVATGAARATVAGTVKVRLKLKRGSRRVAGTAKLTAAFVPNGQKRAAGTTTLTIRVR